MTQPRLRHHIQMYALALGARAIFFVVGDRIHRAPTLLRRIVSEGHVLGNHTFSHPNDRRMAFREYRDDLMKCQQAILDHAGTVARVHRPPHGQLTFASLISPKICGLMTMAWSRSAEDWRFRSDAAAIERADQLSREVKPLDIVLFHDERLHTAVALERLLPALHARGIDLSPDFT